jgi:hypothetical protein
MEFKFSDKTKTLVSTHQSRGLDSQYVHAREITASFCSDHKTKIQADSDSILIKIGWEKKDADSAHSQTDFCNWYCEEKISVRFHLENLLYYLFTSLVKHERSSIGADFFEVCALVYRSDMKCERTCKMWTSHRHGDITTSSTLYHVGFCYDLSKLIQHNIREIKKEPPRLIATDFVQLSGAIREGTVTDVSLNVYRMDHAITLLVPLLLLNAESYQQILRLRGAIKPFMRKDEAIRQFEPPRRDFALEYTLSTSSWLSNLQNTQQNGYIDRDVMTLSSSPLRRGLRGVYALLNRNECTANLLQGMGFQVILARISLPTFETNTTPCSARYQHGILEPAKSSLCARHM